MTTITDDFARQAEARRREESIAKYAHLIGNPAFDPAPAAPKSQQVANPAAPAQPGKETEGGLVSGAIGAAKGVVKGAVLGVSNTMDAIDDAANWLNDNVVNLRTPTQQAAYDASRAAGKVSPLNGAIANSMGVVRATSGAEQFTQGISEFLVGFIPLNRGLTAMTQGARVARGAQAAEAALGTMGKVAVGAAASVGAGATAVDPATARLADHIHSLAPSLESPVLDYLKSDINDSRMEARFKNAVENGLMSVVGDAVLQPLVKGYTVGMKAYKARMETQGVSPAEMLEQGLESLRGVEPPMAPTPMQQQIDAMTGVGGRTKSAVDSAAAFRDQLVNPEAGGVSALNLRKQPGMVDLHSEVQVPPESRSVLKEGTPGAREEAGSRVAQNQRTMADENTIPFTREVPDGMMLPSGDSLSLAPKMRRWEAGYAANVSVSRGGDILVGHAADHMPKGHVEIVGAVQSAAKKLEEVALNAQGKAGFTLSAEEKIALKAYEQMQTMAMKALDVPIAVVEGSGARSAAQSATMASEREAGEAALKAIRENQEKLAQALSDKAKIEGITRNAEEMRKLVAEGKLNPDGSLNMSGWIKSADGTPGFAQTAADKVAGKAAEDAQGEAFKAGLAARKSKIILPGQQAGFIDPTLLTRVIFGSTGTEVGSGAVGAIAGYNADSEASLKDRLQNGLIGYLGGRMAGKALFRSRSPAELAAIRTENPATMAVAETPILAPRTLNPAAKAIPKPNEGTVQQMADLLTKGTPEDIKEATKLFGEAFNPNFIDSSEDVRTLMNLAEGKLAGVFEKARGGVPVSHKETQEMAELIGGNPDTLLKQYQGTGNMGARFLAHRNMVLMSAQRTVDMATEARNLVQGLDSGGRVFSTVAERQAAVDAALLGFRKQLMIHSVMQAELKGVQTEIARALNAMKITANGEMAMAQQLELLIGGAGGRKLNMDMLEKFASLKSPKEIGAFARKGVLAKSWDTLNEVWINSILSGPVTHAANLIGGGLRAVGTVAETAGAGVIKGLRGHGFEVREAVEQTHGMLEGLLDSFGMGQRGLSFAKDSFMKDHMVGYSGAVTGSQIETGLMHAISAQNYGITSPTFAKVVDMMGTVVRLPGRLLQTEDTILSALNYRGELRKQAYRMAKAEQLSGDDLTKRMAELMNPDTMPESLSMQAIKAMREGTFTQVMDPSKGALDKLGSWMQTGKAVVPGVNFVVPFVRTPTNILRYTFDRMPLLSQISASNRAMWEAGGAQRDQLMAQWAFGGSILGLGWYLGSQGILTGGNVLDSKAAQVQGGKPKYSVKIGDTWYSYNRLDPFGMFLAAAADTVDLTGHMEVKDVEELSAAIISANAKNFLSKSYMQGVVQFFGMISDATRNPTGRQGEPVEKYFRNLATGFMPLGSLQNQINKSFFDDTMREVTSLYDAYRARIPGLSQDLPPKRNPITGEELKYPPGAGPDMLSPVFEAVEKDDPVSKEIARLNIEIADPKDTIGKIGMSPAQFQRFLDLRTKEVKVGGKDLHSKLTEMVTSPNWQRMSERQGDYEGRKEQAIKHMIGLYDHAARVKLVRENPEFMADKKNKINALLGRPLIPIDGDD